MLVFAVNNWESFFVVFIFGNQHLWEGGQWGQDRSPDPYRVFTLRRSNDLDLHCGWSHSSDFVLHSVIDSWKEVGATRQYCVACKSCALHDGIVCCLVDTRKFLSNNGWPTHIGISRFHWWWPDHRGARNSSPSWCLYVLFKVKSNITQLLFKATHAR